MERWRLRGNARGLSGARAAHKRVGQEAPRREHGVEELLLVLQREHDHEAARLELEALHELARHHLGGARAVELDHRVALGGLDERAVGPVLAHLRTREGGVSWNWVRSVAWCVVRFAQLASKLTWERDWLVSKLLRPSSRISGQLFSVRCTAWMNLQGRFGRGVCYREARGARVGASVGMQGAHGSSKNL